MKFLSVIVNIVTGVFLIGALGGGSALYFKTHGETKSKDSFRTVTVQRGDLSSTISATGTIEPEEVVNVGSQVSGKITKFGSDRKDSNKTVDYESIVEEGDLLAEIDPITYKISLEQAKATLSQSKANLMEYEAKLKQTEQEWIRAKSLLPQNAIAETDYDTALYNYESAKANVELGRATVQQNEAAVELSSVNLGYCTIKSPVRGTIIDRRVNIGQTVAASLSAPSLFLIAKDLTKMQIWTSVNEADIGHIKNRMNVRFTVDPYPNETFQGQVIQVRKNAQMTQNVVTYMVIVAIDNSDGRLLPYLTANVQFEVEKKENVLLIPNAALRWEPETEQIDPTADQAAISKESEKGEKIGRVWVVTRENLVKPLSVRVGLSDGTMTEISGDEINEGLAVVVGENVAGENSGQDTTAKTDSEETKNPFMPDTKGHKPPPGPM